MQPEHEGRRTRVVVVDPPSLGYHVYIFAPSPSTRARAGHFFSDLALVNDNVCKWQLKLKGLTCIPVHEIDDFLNLNNE